MALIVVPTIRSSGGKRCMTHCRTLKLRTVLSFFHSTLGAVIDNLRCEKYVDDWRHGSSLSALSELYYFARPMLPVVYEGNSRSFICAVGRTSRFRAGPWIRSVESLMRQLLLLSIRSSGLDQIPFIWFWPEGAPSCAIMTHDVETAAGRDFC